MQVQCYACQTAEGPLEPWSYEIAEEPGEGEVDVEISHCGVCHSDLHQIKNAWGVACFPLVPGHEIVGTIHKVGPGVSNFSIGEVVGIGVQRGCCGACDQCSARREHTCPKITKTYAGPGKDKGGFADFIRYPASWTFKVPQGLQREHVAPLLCAGITTYSPLKRWITKPDSVVGIIGIGGLGHLAIQIAANMQKVARVVAISTSASKKVSLNFGASQFLLSTDPEQMKSNAGSLDVILNTVSGLSDMDGYLSLLKPDGVMACVGLPEKTQKQGMYLQSLVLTERRICGSYLGPKHEYEEMFQFCVKHGVKPVVETFPAAAVNDVFAKLEANQIHLRAVLLFPAAERSRQ